MTSRPTQRDLFVAGRTVPSPCTWYVEAHGPCPHKSRAEILSVSGDADSTETTLRCLHCGSSWIVSARKDLA